MPRKAPKTYRHDRHGADVAPCHFDCIHCHAVYVKHEYFSPGWNEVVVVYLACARCKWKRRGPR